MGSCQTHDGSNIVFIVGAPRSGTTWLQRLLASHPRVVTGQESGLFDTYIGPQLRAFRRDINPETNGRGGVGLGCYLTEETFVDLLREYLNRLLDAVLGDMEPAMLFVEKTPSHALYLSEIMELLPRSRIVHLVRDGRDVVASLMAASRSWGWYWAPATAAAATDMWLRHVMAVDEAADAIPAGQFLEVRYEALCRDTAAELVNIFTFMGLDCDADQAAAFVRTNGRDKAAAGSWTPIPLKGEVARRTRRHTVREPAGFVRSKDVGGWRTALSVADREIVEMRAGRLLRRLGYR